MVPVLVFTVAPFQWRHNARMFPTHRETSVSVRGSITAIPVVDDHGLVQRAFRRTPEDVPDLRVVGEASYGKKAIEATAQGQGSRGGNRYQTSVSANLWCLG